MKKTCLLLLSGCLSASSVYSQNLVVNGSFESGPATSANPTVQLTTPSNDVVFGWRAFDTDNPDNVAYYHVYDPNEATDGDYYIRIDSAYEPDEGDAGFDVRQNDGGRVLLEAGVEHTFSFDLRLAGESDYSDIYFNIRSFGAEGLLDEFDAGGLTITESWATYSYSFTPTADVNGDDPSFYFRVSSRFNGATNDQTIHLDNVSLTTIPEPSAATGIIGFSALALGAMRRR